MFKSQKSQLWQCHNVQVPDWRSGPKSTKMARNGSRIVARTWESTPRHATAISKPLGPVPRPKIRQKGQKMACLGSRAGVIFSGLTSACLWVNLGLALGQLFLDLGFEGLPNREGPKPGEIGGGCSGGTRGYASWGYAVRPG